MTLMTRHAPQGGANAVVRGIVRPSALRLSRLALSGRSVRLWAVRECGFPVCYAYGTVAVRAWNETCESDSAAARVSVSMSQESKLTA